MGYLEHTYIWVSTGGDLNLDALQGTFIQTLVISAIVFYVVHCLLPYMPLEKHFFPHLEYDPPPHVILNFSVGQFVQYLLLTLGLPTLLCGLYPYPEAWADSEFAKATVTAVVAVAVLFVPYILKRVIDRW